MKLRPYQEEACDFMFARDRAMVLAAVGAGKTLIAISTIRELISHGHADRWLILAPKRVAVNVWPSELKKWADDLTYSVAVGTPAQRKKAFDAEVDIVITNYDNLPSVPDKGFDGVVFDELTRLKNPSGKRFKYLMKIIDQFKFRYGLTGSFTSNGLIDVFGQCKVVDQSLLGRSKGAFLQQYFYCVNREYGQWEPLPDALPKVMEAIKPATYVLEPGEYKDKLPPLHVVEMRCDMDMGPYNTMKREFVLDLGQTITAPTAAVVTQKLQQLAGGFVYGEAGPEWLSGHKFDMLDDILEENQHANTIVVYNYKEELAELKRRYKLTTIDEDNAVDNWNAGKIQLLAIHPKSAGHGLNLQFGGNKIVFLSLPWSLELYEQTIGRLHRSGQTRDVWCYVILCNKTIDERIFESLKDKRTLAEIALEELK
jgi:SNF2 family DNA or RNA helicase